MCWNPSCHGGGGDCMEDLTVIGKVLQQQMREPYPRHRSMVPPFWGCEADVLHQRAHDHRKLVFV